jgi:hypothetical protein
MLTSVNSLLVMHFGDSLGGLAPGLGRLVVADRGGRMAAVSARLRAHQLDLALAQGASSEATPAIARRARRLVSLRERRSIASSFRWMVKDACDGGRRSRQLVLPNRAQIARAQEELTRLADALTEPGPVAARGVAQALLLLTDGSGPLYNSGSKASLGEYAARATDNLEPALTV